MKRWFVVALSTLLLLLHPAHAAVAFKRLAVGDELADFTLPTLAGETQRLSDVLGTKATLVLFWATWSPRSAEALLDFQELYARHGPQTLTVIAINVDGQEATSERTEGARLAVERNGARYPVLIDEELSVFDELGVVAVPSIVLTDASRRVVGLLDGYAYTTRFDLREKILGLIGAGRAETEPAPSAVAAYRPKGSAAKYLQMGKLYLKKGRHEKARKLFAQAVAEDPHYAGACEALGSLLEWMERHEEAMNVQTQRAQLQASCLPRPLD
jgi:peroxiredoxin